MHTVVVSVVIPNGSDPKPVATIVMPDGEIIRPVLSDHDWSFDWSRDRAPASLYRYLLNLTGGRIPQGDRLAYTSPEDVGTGRNEKGRLTVWEIDYDSWGA
jgi:hypothetical protein